MTQTQPATSTSNPVIPPVYSQVQPQSASGAVHTVMSGQTPLARLLAVEAELNTILIEREEAIRLSLLCLIARQNAFLLGSPGLGKSLLINQLAKRVQPPVVSPSGLPAGLRTFILLLTKFTNPDEVFGPVSVPGLKNEEYRRALKNKLPLAQLVFLDETFKANSAILNALLTVMEERQFDNGGDTRLDLPLISLFGASNEMPDSEELAAFFDRFQVRMIVQPVSEAGFAKLMTLWTSPAAAPQAYITLAELEYLQTEVQSVTIPLSVQQAVQKLKRDLDKLKGITATDRRWGKCLQLMQAHAVLEGRTVVEEEDLTILVNSLWNTPENQVEIRKLVASIANPVTAKVIEHLDAAQGVFNLAKTSYDAAKTPQEKSAVITEVLPKLKLALKGIVDSVPEFKRAFEGASQTLGNIANKEQEQFKAVLAQVQKNNQTQNRPPNRVEKAYTGVFEMRQEMVDLFTNSIGF